MAMVRRQTYLDLSRLNHQRGVIKLLCHEKSGVQEEFDNYLELIELLTGQKRMDREQFKQTTENAKLKYEQLTGYKYGSKEFEDAVDQTIRCMTAQ